VIATAGGREVNDIPGSIPDNARFASYLPFEWLLPKVDVLVTNGGYGSVNQAMSFGTPLVTAGLTEDKADVNVRVAWSGVGINLAAGGNVGRSCCLLELPKGVNGPVREHQLAVFAAEKQRLDRPQEDFGRLLRIFNLA
jgi:hypothetical protein